mmetsp:Transcript_51442/g.149443  ORF Transcript_51442/g.149443 Transcript_51442/m.149443 type:complete len:240 (+) Transcript_51442:98-817(+)
MVRPINMFCCGCPLTFGVTVILIFNLIQNLFYVATSFCNIILKIPTFGVSGGPMTQTFNGAWSMLGLPFIIVGFWGVSSRLESHVRMYFGYLLVSLLVDFGFLASNFVFRDICDDVPLVLRKHGSAFACGFMRIVGALIVVLVVTIESYFVFTVWSLCEDLRAAPSGSALPDLLRNAREAKQHQNHHAYLGHTLYGAPVAPGYPAGYGTLSTQGLGTTGTRIGFGNYQDSESPPTAKLS